MLSVIVLLTLHLFLRSFFNDLLTTFRSIYLSIAALGLCCCVRVFSSCWGWGGLLSAALCRLLIVVASLVAEKGLSVRRLQ